MTPTQAIQNLDACAANLAGNRATHDALKESVQVMSALINEAESLHNLIASKDAELAKLRPAAE